MLSDSVFVVTGAGRGIGRAVAFELADNGASVVVNDLGVDLDGTGADADPAETVAREIREAGGDAMAHFGDVTDLEYVQTLLEDALSEYGRVDGVANFAGNLRSAPIHEMTGEMWDAVVHVHLRGHFALLRTFSEHWVERDGTGDRSFVAVSSPSALGHPTQSNYAASKAGILGLVRSTREELAPYNVRVNALVPKAYTRMTESVPDEPFGEDVSPDKVAPMVGYLFSEAAADVTGCTVYAGDDEIGFVSEPQITRVGVKDDGWSIEDIAERFSGNVTQGIDLNRESRP
ncbi:SDR family NAD(P)-dependent oxidoreductase [Halovivax limisalsi]|uniref:SDR family NAD(P)-dependent oxidoreductase n=1 Tax=Halovivax limisalsi TaxID=1453760 RepID=UPI001FFC746D|nr:SDR family NAD(P)-dependent oxidoreductase [Halovivax limisalsi]